MDSRALQCRRYSKASDCTARTLVLLLFVVFVDLLGVGLVIPLLPYYAVDLKATASQIGMLSSFYGILQLIGSTLVGKMSDQYGRKAVLCLSMIGAGISYFSMTLATSLPMLFLTRVPVGLFKQTMMIATIVVSDISPPKDRAKFIGFVGTAVGLGFILGPLLGGVMSTMLGKEYPAYLSATLFALDLFLVAKYLPEPSNLSRIAFADGSGDAEAVEELREVEHCSTFITRFTDSMRKAFGSSAVAYLLGIQFMATLAEVTFRSTFQQFAFERYQLTPSLNGYLVAYMSMLEVVVNALVIGPLTKLWSDGELIRVAVVVYSVFAFIVGTMPVLLPVFFLLIPVMVSSGVSSTCITSSISKHAPIGELGTIMGLAGSFSSVCRAISPYFGGVIVDIWGPAYGTALVAVIGFSLFLCLQWRPIESFGRGLDHTADRSECELEGLA